MSSLDSSSSYIGSIDWDAAAAVVRTTPDRQLSVARQGQGVYRVTCATVVAFDRYSVVTNLRSPATSVAIQPVGDGVFDVLTFDITGMASDATTQMALWIHPPLS